MDFGNNTQLIFTPDLPLRTSRPVWLLVCALAILSVAMSSISRDQPILGAGVIAAAIAALWVFDAFGRFAPTTLRADGIQFGWRRHTYPYASVESVWFSGHEFVYATLHDQRVLKLSVAGIAPRDRAGLAEWLRGRIGAGVFA